MRATAPLKYGDIFNVPYISSCYVFEQAESRNVESGRFLPVLLVLMWRVVRL
jgi:hypothetical protein